MRGKDVCIYHIPLLQTGCDAESLFKWNAVGLKSDFFPSGCLTKVKEPSLSYNLFIAGGRTDGFMPFPSILTLFEMQTSLFRIWTQVTDSFSYIDNCYAKHVSNKKLIYIFTQTPP